MMLILSLLYVYTWRMLKNEDINILEERNVPAFSAPGHCKRALLAAVVHPCPVGGLGWGLCGYLDPSPHRYQEGSRQPE